MICPRYRTPTARPSYANQVTTLPEGGELVSSGVFFGKSSGPNTSSEAGAPICSKPENHTLIVAKTRTGKGTRVIIPTLLRAWKTSALVIDPKGENAVITARPRSLTNHVHIMNPWGELGDTYRNLGFPPATFNPLDILDRNDPNVVSIAQSMGTTMSPSEGQKEPFWAASAANIIAAVLLWLTDQPGEEKTLGRLADILSRSRKSFTTEYVARMAASRAFGGAIRRLSSPFLDMPDVTYGGIMGHIAQAVAFLTDPQIVAATAKSSFSMRDLTGYGKDRPTTLYLVVPWDKIDIQKIWLRLMITAGMHTFRRKPPGSRYRCLFLIDEFPALGRIEDMPREIAGMSGAGVDFALVVQGLSKLKDVYGESHADIIGNCAYKWFCNVNDLQSAEYLSKTLGQRTVRTTSRGENTGHSRSPSGHSSSEGENISYSETGQPLLRPEDAMNLGSDTAILLAPNSRPHYLRPIDYWDLPEAFAMFREANPYLYWPLYYDYNHALDPSKRAGAGHAATCQRGTRHRSCRRNRQTRAATHSDRKRGDHRKRRREPVRPVSWTGCHLGRRMPRKPWLGERAGRPIKPDRPQPLCAQETPRAGITEALELRSDAPRHEPKKPSSDDPKPERKPYDYGLYAPKPKAPPKDPPPGDS